MLRAGIRYGLLGLLFACACIINGSEIRRQIHDLRRQAATPAYPFRLAIATRTITSGAFAGDQLLAMNGIPVVSADQVNHVIGATIPGHMLRLTLAETGGRAIERVIAVPSLAARTNTAEAVAKVCANILLPLISLAAGFAVAFIRPSDPHAWIMLATLLGFSEIFADRTGWRGLTEAWAGFWISLWPGFIVWFGLRFPERFRWERRQFLVKFAFLAFSSAAGFFWFAVILLWRSDINTAQVFRGPETRAHFIWLTSVVVAIAVFFTSQGLRIRLGRTPDTRRRSKIVLAGAAVALPPAVLFYTRHSRQDWPGGAPWPAILSGFAIIAMFPLTLAFGLLAERAMDLRFILRRCLIGRRQSAGGLSRWLDRRFFREDYEAGVAVGELAEEAGGFTEIPQLLQSVAKRVGDALHVLDIVILIRENDNFRTAYTTRPGEHLDIPASSGIVAALAATRRPLRVWFENAPRWIRGLGVRDLQTLDFMRTQLLIPIPGEGAPAGIISLGPKLSAAPWSDSEIRPLQAVAAQMARLLARENGNRPAT
jgi:phosphoserine phosphatase RsbU/P